MNSIKLTISSLILVLLFLFQNNTVFSQQYIVLSWNDLGMHCANKDFSKIAVLPPYNNVLAQIIKKQSGQPPQVLTIGFTIEYNIPGNTYSVGKTNFWTYAQELFSLPQPLPNNIGLTGHGLTGMLDTSGNGFIITGVPITPFQDNNLIQESPFQLIHLALKQTGNPTVIAYTDVVIPVSNEIGCVQSGCHSSEQQIKNEHEDVPGFHLNTPELCARCHASNALGTTGDSVAKAFSYRIHEKHHDIQPINGIETCYKCHPGPNTQCFRDVMRNQGNMVCQNCHGTMENLANSILNGRRPWLDEPRCGSTTCHGSLYSEETGKLYRMSRGHGGLYCSACHSSPHSILPSREANDNLQNIRLQGFAGTLKNCLVCHSTAPTGPGPHGIYYIGVKPISNEIPKEYKLNQNYPNPFNPQTTITFDVPASSVVDISIFDNLGRLIETPVNQTKLNAGKYEYKWNAENLPSGVYFCKLTAGNYINTIKMILLK